MTLIWKRYFFRELAKVFLLFIGCFYFLYVLIDYSAHTKTFHQEGLPFFKVILYYLCQFTKRCDILIPTALMISSIKVLTSLNMRNEITAMVTGGIPTKTLFRPFFTAAFVSIAFLFLNFQYIQPLSLNHLNLFEENFFKGSSKDGSSVNHLLLKDNSLFIYQAYNSEQETFFDSYWIRSNDELYRIKTLYPYAQVPTGRHVDLLIRQPSGELIRQQNFKTLLFPEMEFEGKTLYAAAHPPRLQSISELFKSLSWGEVALGMGKMNDREAEIATIFFYKLTIPLVCILAVMGPAPFCIRFGRHLPVFFIYTLSLFGIITLFTLINSSVILGESQLLPPFWALLLPSTLAFLIFGWSYAKL